MERIFNQDIEAVPEFFELRIPLSRREIERLDHQVGAPLPPSYREILETYGQGIIFDNESFLGAHELEPGLGEMVEVNAALRKQGLLEHLIVFHVGTGGMHAFDVRDGGPEYPVVALDEDTLEPGREFDDFDSWYVEFLRETYAHVLELD